MLPFAHAPAQLVLWQAAGRELSTADVRHPNRGAQLDLEADPRFSLGENPYLKEFVLSHLSPHDGNAVEALTGQLVAGKNTYVYDAHTYHTKVPPAAIQQVLSHYSQEGDLVLDPFCGSGMTGVAAREVNRIPVLVDLSPAATFISYNFLTPMDPQRYWDAVCRVLDDLEPYARQLYHTNCRVCGREVAIEYMVWCYDVVCSNCETTFSLWDVALDERPSVRESKVLSEFPCPKCGLALKKRQLKRQTIKPVQIGYKCCSRGLKEVTCPASEEDLLRVAEADRYFPENLWYPTDQLPKGVNTRQPIVHGLDTIDKLYTRRALLSMALLWNRALHWRDRDEGIKLLFTINSLYKRVTKLSEFRFWGGSGNTANLNVPMIMNEQNVFKAFARKAKTIRDYFQSVRFRGEGSFCISTQTATTLGSVPSDSIDFVFTDPPFGANINYSEMNFLWEAWLRRRSEWAQEAVINKVQGKDVDDYGRLMGLALQEVFRVLKSGHWMTMVFHNSSARVWHALREQLTGTGFEVHGVQLLDKVHGTFKNFVSENTVGYDLVVHCKKPMANSGTTVFGESRGIYRHLEAFLLGVLRSSEASDLRIRYSHVARADELNYRRFFSLWLSHRIMTAQDIDMDFDEFRSAVHHIMIDRGLIPKES